MPGHPLTTDVSVFCSRLFCFCFAAKIDSFMKATLFPYYMLYFQIQKTSCISELKEAPKMIFFIMEQVKTSSNRRFSAVMNHCSWGISNRYKC